MTEPLTLEELARMRRDHVRHPQWGICLKCADNDYRRDPRGEWPCDAAKLLGLLDVLFSDRIVELAGQVMSEGEWEALKAKLVAT